MIPTPPRPGLTRPAAVVQAEIHALLVATGGWLWGPTRELYEQLRDEWVAAEAEAARVEIVEAA
ncbi:hypothetical protein TUSST3_09830 [Streptomyces sp. TUS-ST3]|uniref:hypothetical protein n=1 Tax=Streptomyces sp. TUS-ST3 TaxID=3025591 RepID=UPI0024E0CDFF|nr:hypothetical protein [Streptomyces sp. TUS-ST3]GLP64363.1 hypothetical protein TUSST3_09830 [Streptomyces sp. TUS-ST3]